LAYFSDSNQLDVSADNISQALKHTAWELKYPTIKGIPIEQINTCSLRSRDANAQALTGYSDTQIQKDGGRWWATAFKDCIQHELACFLSGIS
jgi:hypothetical protein